MFTSWRRRPQKNPVPAPDPRAAAALAAFEAAPAPLLALDGQRMVTLTNAAFRALAPDSVDAEGRHVALALRAPAVIAAIEAAVTRGAAGDVVYEAHGEHERQIRARVTPIPGGGAVVALDDETRMRRAEQQRIDFIANASHELRTPLASIAGFVETLRGAARDDPEASGRFLEIIARQTERMTRLVGDLMSLSRIELNEHVPPRGAVDLGGLLAEVAAALRPVAQARGGALEATPPRDAHVIGDHDELTQVFVNLIDNALKYGGDGGPVRVFAAGRRAGAVPMIGIVVADQGPGVERAHIARLTERFYRVSTASSRKKGGTGLGLAIVKHVVSRHRGQLEIDSAPGKGMRVTVWLPESPMRPAAAAATVTELS